ncbi:MAG: sensor histidine kinase [Spirochaetia bacterium]
MMSQADDTIEAMLKQVEVVRTQVILKAISSEALLSRPIYASPQLDAAALEMREFLQNLRLSFRFLSNIYIIGSNGVVFSSAAMFDSGVLLSKPWIKDLRDFNKPRQLSHLHHPDYVVSPDVRYVFSIAQRIARVRNQEAVVRIVLDISSDELAIAMRWVNLGKNGEVLIADRDGVVLASGHRDHVGKLVQDLFGEGTFIPSPNTEGVTRTFNGNLTIQRWIVPLGWMLSVVPLSEFYGQFTSIRDLFLFVTLGFVALTISLSLTLSRRITEPLHWLSGAMNRIQDGDFSVRLQEGGTREISTLARSFNTMGAEITALMRKISLRERETLRAELLALRLQINPHFLYNTLEVMRGIALSRGARDAAEIARGLSALLRYSTAKGKETTLVADEITSLRYYLAIQKHRFGGRFATRIRIDPDIVRLQIPRFILQPLVENVFKHAVERSTERVTITIRVHVEGKLLLLEVNDTGPGINERKAMAIRRSLAAGKESSNRGIGLHNVHNRIRLAYGDAYGLSIGNNGDRGTRVCLRLPREGRPDGI